MRLPDHLSGRTAAPVVKTGAYAPANPTIARFLATSARYLASSAGGSAQIRQHNDVDDLRETRNPTCKANAPTEKKQATATERR